MEKRVQSTGSIEHTPFSMHPRLVTIIRKAHRYYKSIFAYGLNGDLSRTTVITPNALEVPRMPSASASPDFIIPENVYKSMGRSSELLIGPWVVVPKSYRGLVTLFISI